MRFISLTLLAVIAAGCGAAERANQRGNGKSDDQANKANSAAADGQEDGSNAAADGASGGFSLDDDEAVAIEAQVEEALGATTAETDDGDAVEGFNAKWSFGGQNRHASASAERKCREEEGDAIISIERHAERSADAQGDLGTASKDFERSYKKERRWTQPGTDLKCNSRKTAVVLPFDLQALNGLELHTTFERSGDRAREVTPAGEAPRSLTAQYRSKGSRDFTFAVEDLDGTLKLTHTIAMDVERHLSYSDSNGNDKDIKTSIRTGEGNPLVIIRERKKGHLIAGKVTVQSGSIESLLRNGNTVQVTVDNVVIERGAGLCKRSSGTVEGKIFSPDGKELKSFKVDLDADQADIVLADGTTKTIRPKLCD